MSKIRSIRSAEAALLGQPDKIADFIGDSILDAILRADPYGRGGIQIMVTGLTVLVGGQIKTKASIDVSRIVFEAITAIGYADAAWGFPPGSVVILDKLDQQTDELVQNIERGGAGDSACVYGHACSDTEYLVPMAYHLAQSFAVDLDSARRKGALPGIGPDGKVQVAIEYAEGRPIRLHSMILSLQNRGQSELANAHAYFREVIIPQAIPKRFFDERTIFNFRTGVGFTVGGPRADTGLSSRKVIADTYGAGSPWGGGGLSGKDPTKIDRCGSYAARRIAKSVVAAGFSKACDVMLSYSIGREQPLALDVSLSDGIEAKIQEKLNTYLFKQDLSTETIIEMLDLRQPMYRSLSFGGHFGRNAAQRNWERADVLSDM